MDSKNKSNNYTSKYFSSIESKTIEGYSPDSRAYFISEIIDSETIMIHGGSNKKEEYQQIDIFDSSTLEWKMIHEFSTLDPFFIFDKKLSGHSSNLVNIKGKNTIVIYGGFDGKFYSNAIYLIDPENFLFQQVDVRGDKSNNSVYPASRSYHSSNYDPEENCLYIFGGWNCNITAMMSKNFLSLWKFDMNCKNILYNYNYLAFMWEQISLENKSNSMISLRGHSSALLLKSKKLLIYGGVIGFTKFSDKIFEISLLVWNILIFMIIQ